MFNPISGGEGDISQICTCALVMINIPNPPSSLSITDFGFNIPWASVLLVLEYFEQKYFICVYHFEQMQVNLM